MTGNGNPAHRQGGDVDDVDMDDVDPPRPGVDDVDEVRATARFSAGATAVEAGLMLIVLVCCVIFAAWTQTRAERGSLWVVWGWVLAGVAGADALRLAARSVALARYARWITGDDWAAVLAVRLDDARWALDAHRREGTP